MSRPRWHTESTVLEVGARGRFRGSAFELAGRTLVESDFGGVWNEWNVALDGGGQAFLAEAMGSFVWMLERPIVPSFDRVKVGAFLSSCLVVERDRARRVARWGDVPPSPASYHYADLSSVTGERATIDYGNSSNGFPEVFVGHTVSLSQIGLSPRVEHPRFVPVVKTRPPKSFRGVLALGDEGTLPTGRGRSKFRVVGILQRSVREGGKRYLWDEYVLHHAAAGLRWLVVSNGHWNLVEGINAAAVHELPDEAHFDGDRYKSWSSGRARVEWADGELPWRVRKGMTVLARDYVCAPYILSVETTANEIAWSRGTYLPAQAVAHAFHKTLSAPTGRAPNQPSTSKRR